MRKRSSLKIFISVVNALFLREIKTRFGTQKLGYFWAIFDPMTKVIMFSIIKIALLDRGLPGVEYSVFLATSFLTYNMYQSVMNNSMFAFESNQSLFAYKQVKPIDTIFARFLVEVLIMFITIIIFGMCAFYLNLDLAVKNLTMVLIAILWFSIFALGIGILFAIIGTFYTTFRKIIKAISLPLFFASGLLYTIESLPPIAQSIIVYNPIVHFIEMIHGNYFEILNTKYVDYTYMAFWTFIPLFLGLLFYVFTEKKIIAS